MVAEEIDDGILPAGCTAGFDSVSPSFNSLLRRHCHLLLRGHFIGIMALISSSLRRFGSL